MTEDKKPLYRINDFFEGYAKALERQDTKYMSGCYAMPCTFISDDSSQAYTTVTKLEGLINQSKRFYALHGISYAEADITNKLEISPNIARVKLNWRYYNKQDKLVYSCDYFYILRMDDKAHWRIEVAISINEKQEIDRLNQKMEKTAK